MAAAHVLLERKRRALDDWYRRLNAIYLDRNFHRDASSLFAHLVEVSGGLSLMASTKQKAGVTRQSYVPKALAWWMALCGKIGVRSVEDMIWMKFPGVCTYCHRERHVQAICQQEKQQRGGTPNWELLEQLGRQNRAKKPTDLASWQRMFGIIYEVSSTEDYPTTFARLMEELGELAEALRVFRVAPAYFLSEGADVFAWLMHLQNVIETKEGIPYGDHGRALAEAFSEAYPDQCTDCRNPVCICPPILPRTLGRIAHEGPAHAASFVEGGALLPPDQAMELFQLGTREIRVGDRVVEVRTEELSALRDFVQEFRDFSVRNDELAGAHSARLISVLEKIEELASLQRVMQDNVEDLASVINSLPSESRNAAMSWLNGLGSSVWASVILEAIRRLHGG